MKELTVEITDKCSLNCIQCSTEAGPEGSVFFTVEQITSILKRYSGFQAVRLSGGEPLEHPQLAEIVRLIAQQGKEAYILSCGVKDRRAIPEKDWQKIRPFTKEVVFSYHGFCDTHEQIVTSDLPWNHPPYWDMLCDSAENANWVGVPFSFQTVVMSSNYDSLEEIARHMDGFRECFIHNARSAGRKPNPRLHWHLLRFVKQGRGAENDNQALTQGQTAELIDKVYQLSIQYPDLNISFTNSFELTQCDCGSQKAVVTCRGEEIPCSALKNYDGKKGRFPCLERV